MDDKRWQEVVSELKKDPAMLDFTNVWVELFKRKSSFLEFYRTEKFHRKEKKPKMPRHINRGKKKNEYFNLGNNKHEPR